MGNTASFDQLDQSEYAPYFQKYIEMVPAGDIRESLNAQIQRLNEFLAGVSNEDANKLHETYSWTIKQVIGHMIDTEKIFGCRAHRIACADSAELPGFDQDAFVANSNYDDVTLDQLAKEFDVARATTNMFFNRLPEESWSHSGSCDGKQISVRAIAFLLAGHLEHHLSIMKQRLA